MFNWNKSLLLGVAAATALVGAAFLYHYMCEDDEEEEVSERIRRELIEAGLGDKVVRNKNKKGELDYDYTCKLLNFLTITSRKRLSKERAEMIIMRQEAY